MAEKNSGNFADNVQNFANQMNATPDQTNQFSSQDIQQNKVMALFSYIGIFVLIPIFAAKDSKYARFHANQGLVLFITEIVVGFAVGIISLILNLLHLGFLGSFISGICSIIFLILIIVGIVNALQGKAKQLPIIGGITVLK